MNEYVNIYQISTDTQEISTITVETDRIMSGNVDSPLLDVILNLNDKDKGKCFHVHIETHIHAHKLSHMYEHTFIYLYMNTFM
jgi:hypothetical protein